MRAQDSEKSTALPAQRLSPTRPDTAAAPAAGGLSPQAVLALQRSIGNAAASRLIEQSRHQHGAGCGHPQDSAPVQRATAHDVLRGGGQPLDPATRTDMEARLGADFSDVRLHTGTTAQRSAAEVGARAYTSGNHVVIGDGGADKHTLAHELTHVIQQRQGPVAGTDNGNGLRVSDPSDRFERAAEANAAKVMAAPAPGRAAEALSGPVGAQAHGHGHADAAPVQRMPQGDQGGGRFALQDHSELSAEAHIASLPEDSEQEVILKRGVTPTQKKYLQKEVIRGSFVSLPKILQAPDENATKPEADHVHGYLSQHRNDETAKLIEFSADAQIAAKFASEARFGYVLTIRIKRKYLAKGATGSEQGWIAKQGAPYEIVAIERSDSTQPGMVRLTEPELREAAAKEEMAEFLLSVQDPAAMAAHLSRFEGPAKAEEIRKILGYKAAVYAE
ncbi:DUF4157 domain-containing protein [Streptacidiphilus sp. PB12-B1b]|uniref:eCIS core domain-containing protein n=1 Tax=Streptacidiphilus sp. PB12-B1b TaxID=2705012 RepID=UPI001CDCAFAD|nr:DUF4157 domain-containing protein [Streptacidiphilus sp. PB12-B1b]